MARQSPREPGVKTVIRAARLIDGTGECVDGGAVLFEGDRILDCGPRTRIGAVPDAVEINTTGTVMPGMVDVHVHLRGPGTPSEGPGAALDMARTIVRRAERRMTQLEDLDNPHLLAYINRLSSLLFVLSLRESSQILAKGD